MQRIATGELTIDLPTKQVFTDDSGGDFRVMPCVVRGVETTSKTVKIVGTNIVGQVVPDQITVGRAFQVDPAENFISASFDACVLSSARTGAVAALAIDRLMESPNSMTLLGAGRVASFAATYVCDCCSIRRLTIVDPHAQRRDKLAAYLREVYPHVDVHATASLENDRSDVVVIATTARALVLPADRTRADLVVSLGADSDQQSELGDEWPKIASLFVDGPDCLLMGDAHRWLERGLVVPEDMTNLVDIHRPDFTCPAGRRVFVSTGSALLDNLTIQFLLGSAEF
jgi:ornithine cyclodeaminase/alanine dehydrogenase-like protein (mu-crystallin family)